jgi:hypothetical protein
MTPNTSSKSTGLRALTPKSEDLHANAGSGRDRGLSETPKRTCDTPDSAISSPRASLLELFR